MSTTAGAVQLVDLCIRRPCREVPGFPIPRSQSDVWRLRQELPRIHDTPARSSVLPPPLPRRHAQYSVGWILRTPPSANSKKICLDSQWGEGRGERMMARDGASSDAAAGCCCCSVLSIPTFPSAPPLPNTPPGKMGRRTRERGKARSGKSGNGESIEVLPVRSRFSRAARLARFDYLACLLCLFVFYLGCGVCLFRPILV